MRSRLLILGLVLSHEFAATASADFELKGEDRVVFFGDSLVYADGFVKFVETFVRVKYPTLDVRFYDAGLRRQTAGDGLRRVDEDLNLLSPTVAVVCFGFDDPDRQALDEGKLSEFRKDYSGIVERIKRRGCRIILVTPACPGVRILPQKPGVDYVEVVGQYAQAVRDIGSVNEVPVVDWYESSRKLVDQEDVGVAARTRRPEIVPPRLAHAMLAADLLKYWKADPIRVDIEIDWVAATAHVSSGRAGVTRTGDHELSVKLEGIPLSWALPSLKPDDLLRWEWPGADLCQYVLRMKNIPQAGIELAFGRQTQSLASDRLADGVNAAGWKPLQVENDALRTLLGYYASKRKFQLDYLREVRPRRPEEPELLEAWELLGRAYQLYEEGTHRVMMRMLKTTDVLLVFREATTATHSQPTSETQPGSESR